MLRKVVSGILAALLSATAALASISPAFAQDGPVVSAAPADVARPGYLGAALQDRTGADSISRVYVAEVGAGTPAAEAGLKAGDGVISIAGKEVKTVSAAKRIIAGQAPGTHVPIVAFRNGAPISLIAEITARPSDKEVGAVYGSSIGLGQTLSKSSTVTSPAAIAAAKMSSDPSKRYGMFGALIGSSWAFRNDPKYGRVFQFIGEVDRNGNRGIVWKEYFPNSDHEVIEYFSVIRPGKAESFHGDGMDFFIAEDGSILKDDRRYSLIGQNTLLITGGKLKGRTFLPSSTPKFIIADRMTATQVAALQQDMARFRAAKAASSGSGFGSILAGAAMGAILGGGGQSSVDLAVAGAQAAAQGGNTLDVLNSMGGVAAANAAESKRQLDETIARAQGGNSGGSSTGYSGSTTAVRGTASSPATSRPAMTRKTIQVYYTVGTVMRDDDDHNTHCQSSIFSVTIDWDPSLENDGGNLKYANALLDPMKSRFAEKCSGAGRPVTALANVDWFADAFDSSGGGWGSGRQLRKGDIEVQMP